MKTLWTSLSIIAIAHILALAAFAAFLIGTGRVNRARLDEVKAIFTPTIIQQEQTAADAKEKAEKEKLEAEKRERLDLANPGVESRNAELHTMEQMMREKIDRANRDMQAMQQLIDSKLADVARREKDLTTREQAFHEEVDRIRNLQSDEQFQKTVALMSALKPDDLKSKLDVYLVDGKVDLVVDILDALPARNASKLLSLYQSATDNRVAADLLLRLKDRGISSETLGTPDDKPSAARSP